MRIIRRSLWVMAALLGATRPCFPQIVSTGVPFLRIPSSVESHALGQIATLLVDDPLAVRENPALVPLHTTDGMVHGALYAPVTRWLPGLQLPITIESQGGTVAIRLSGDDEEGWTLGGGVSNVRMSLGKFMVTLNDPTPVGSIDSWERALTVSAGVAYTGPVVVSAGVAMTQIQSRFPIIGMVGPVPAGSGQAMSWSWGALVTVPLFRLLEGARYDDGLRPFADLTTALAVTDIGHGITFDDGVHTDPLPRSASMGASVSAGVRASLLGQRITLVKVEVLREAEDQLVDAGLVAGRTQWWHQGGIGDLRPLEDVIEQRGSRKVVSRKGLRVAVGDLFSVSRGSFFGAGFELIRTSGFTISTRGASLLLRSWLGESGSLGWLFEHVAIGFARSRYAAPPGHILNETEFQSISFTIH